LQARLADLVAGGGGYAEVRAELGLAAVPAPAAPGRPQLTEPWFCCAEPTEQQLALARPERR
jgi:hypothetical protein